MQKMTFRLFDDRVFMPDGNEQEALALTAALGFAKEKNPVVAKIAGERLSLLLYSYELFTLTHWTFNDPLPLEFIAPALEMVKVGLSVFRAGFNLFTWRDPYLTFLFQLVCIMLMCILIVFPWRLFFFGVGFVLVGPQVSMA